MKSGVAQASEGMNMGRLPNGFTGYAGADDGFESAADAIRRQHAAQKEGQPTKPAHYAPKLEDDRKAQPRRPFEMSEANPEAMPAMDKRWAWMEVDLSAIRHNVAETRRYLKPRCRLLAVVKADAYGHGVVEVSKAVLGAGADCLAVSTVADGVRLRKAGVTAPIIMLDQPPAASIPLLLGNRITPSVYEPDFAVAYGEAADLHGMKAPYHLAVNTGMNRIGVQAEDALRFLDQVDFHRALVLEGVFTHFATADCAETLELQIQARRFAETVSSMQAAGYDPGVVHAANSAAIFRFPEVHFDMARAGVCLYGFHPCPETRGVIDLRPAMSVHARIVDVRAVPMSEGVSYGLHYRSPGSVKVCTLPIGYADGLQRRLSGNTDFIMGGRYFRQVGIICMDQCMFEVDMRSYGTRERIDPQVGDEVLVVGNQGIAEVTIDEMAAKLGTIHYEVAIGFGLRLERVYV